MVDRPDRSVERTSGQAELVDEFRNFAKDQRAFTREVTSAIKELGMSMAAKGMFSTDRNAGKSLTAEARRMMQQTDTGLFVPGSLGDSEASVERAKARARAQAGDTSGFGSDFNPLARPANEPNPAFDHPHPSPRAPGRPKSYHLSPNFKESRKQGLRGVRDAVFDRATQWANNLGGNNAFEQVTVPEDMDVGSNLRHAPTIPKGAKTKQVWRNMKTFDVVEEAEAAAGIRKGLRGAAVKEGLSKMAEGGTLSEGVATALPAFGKALGVAGLAVAAVDQVRDAQERYAKQVEANRPFQQVLGGGQSEGYGERFRQNIFRLKNKFSFNPIGDRDSEAIYQGALELYAGDKTMRNVAQKQMTDILRSTGQGPEQTLALFKTAAKAGVDSLGLIASSLKDVTKTAREAGMNAQEARDKFSAVYADISKSIAGSGGVALAAAQTQAITSAGHQFSGVTFDNGRTADLFQAIQSGQSMGQVAATNMSSTKSAAVSSDERRRNAVKYTFQNKIEDIFKARGISIAPGEKISVEQQRLVAQQLLSETGIDPTVIQQNLSGLGGMEGLTRSDAALAAVKVAAGQFDTAPLLTERTEKFTDPSKRAGKDIDYKSRDGAVKFMQQVLGMSHNDAITLEEHIDDADRYVKSGSVHGRNAAILLYMQQLRRGQPRSTITEGLISKEGYSSSRRYAVTTAGGKEHIVGTNEIITDFMDQAQAGKLQVTKGDGQGSSVASLFNLDEKDLPGYNETQTSEEKDYTGKKNFDKDKQESPTGTIIVKAAPELARWIQLQGADGTVVRTEGYPNSGNVTPSQRQTGGG